MILVTGGAGFIGSNIVAALAGRGDRVAVCDWLGTDDKWRNLSKHRLWDVFPPEALEAWLAAHAPEIRAIVHMGAISATTEKDVDLIIRSNFQLSKSLWEKCAANGWTFIYASSAATYGDGTSGFDDRLTAATLTKLRPLNAYGWSKHMFDQRVVRMTEEAEPVPPKWAGLKFFNVYGPNEYHKGSMRSVIAVNYPVIASGGPMKLFKSYRADYEDGGQKRDFVYVVDCVSIVLWMLDNAFPSGIYNVGSGLARSWMDIARSLFRAVTMPEKIEFIEMPDTLRGQYQYFTEAPMNKLQAAGYHNPLTALEDGVTNYVERFLAAKDIYL